MPNTMYVAYKKYMEFGEANLYVKLFNNENYYIYHCCCYKLAEFLLEISFSQTKKISNFLCLR